MHENCDQKATTKKREKASKHYGNKGEKPSRTCCQAQDAQCLSCQAGKSIEAFCNKNPNVTGCTTQFDLEMSCKKIKTIMKSHPESTENEIISYLHSNGYNEKQIKNMHENCDQKATTKKREKASKHYGNKGEKPSRTCCQAQDAQCLSCQAGKSIE